MSRFVEGEDRRQPTLLQSCLDDYVARRPGRRTPRILAYNLKRVMQILGPGPLMAAMRT